MNLQKTIRRILREEDFVPLEDLNTVIKEHEDGFDVFIMNGDKKIGEISFAKEEQPNQYTIVDATMDDKYKGNRIYPKTIINLFKEKPNIIINSVFRSPQAEKSWRYILSNLPSNIGKSVKYYKDEDTTLYQLKLTNIQEHIKKVLREEDYSPAGKEITPNKIVIHKSNPMFRDKIMEEGLKVRAGECYQIYVGYGVKCKPAIFATNSTNKRAWFASQYDDDIWEINTEMIPDVKWYKDRHFESRSKHIVTFQDIPKEALTLKYEGTGSGDVEKWNKNSPNLYESIRRILREDKKMKIKSIKVIKGKNKWSESKTKLIHMVLDLGEFEQKPSNKIDGFYERIKKHLPSLKSHRCSIGKPGGFFQRIKEGTWMGHIIEHVALELQTLAGYDTGWGRTRGVKGEKGVYNVVFNYENEECGKLAAKEAFNVVHDIINNKDPKIDQIVKKLKPKTLKESIRKVLREENKLPLFIRRRFHLIDEEVQKLIRGVYTPYKICREYTSGTQLTTVISHAVIENLYFHTFYDIDDESKEWEEIAQSIWNYIHEKYGKEIDKYYHINCV